MHAALSGIRISETTTLMHSLISLIKGKEKQHKNADTPQSTILLISPSHKMGASEK